MAVKLDIKVIYYEKLSPITSHNTLNMWSRHKFKVLYLNSHNIYGDQTYQVGYIQ